MNSAEYFGLRLGIFIAAAGISVIGIAYVIIALQMNSQIPNSSMWPKLYETAFAIGWVLMAIGVLAVGVNIPKKTKEPETRGET